MSQDASFSLPDPPVLPEYTDCLSSSDNGCAPKTGSRERRDISALLQRIRTALDSLDSPALAGPESLPGAGAIAALMDAISRMQDDFLEALYSALEERGADIRQKVTLRLDESARLSISGAHPDMERIRSLLAERPDFSASFAAISVHSSLLRNLRNLQNAAVYTTPEAAYVALAATPGDNIYQLSLKGEMNHFYFTR